MKTLITISLLLFAALTHAYPIDGDGNPLFPINLSPRCEAVADIAVFAYSHRDQASEDAVLMALASNWEMLIYKTPGIKWSDYVDMQRIIRDAYRTNRDGKFIRECCSQDVVLAKMWQEVYQCYNGQINEIEVVPMEEGQQHGIQK